MATNLAIDPGLLDAAHKIGKHRTKKATVTEALEEYLQRRQQRRVLDLFGTIDYDEDRFSDLCGRGAAADVHLDHGLGLPTIR